MSKYYIGLSNSCQDLALAIADEKENIILLKQLKNELIGENR